MSASGEPPPLPAKEVRQAIRRSFCGAWVPSIGLPLVLAAAAIPVDWFLQGHDRAAWKLVTGDDFRSALIVFFAATVLSLTWHVFTAPIKYARTELQNERGKTVRAEATVATQNAQLKKVDARTSAIKMLERLIASGESLNADLQKEGAEVPETRLDSWLKDCKASLSSAANTVPGSAETFDKIAPLNRAVAFGGPPEDARRPQIRVLTPKLDYLRKTLIAL